MSQTIVALDCMGGDYAPLETVKGAVEAINGTDDIKVILCGRKEDIEKELSKYQYSADRLEIVDAREIIETAEGPVQAIRQKTDSSMVRAMKLVREGTADGMVSAGNTGANLVGGRLVIGRLKGVDRTPLAPLIPTSKGVSLLIDCGANVDAKPKNLVQFAQIGTVYMETILGKKNPTVGLVNIGAEEDKGNALTKEAYQRLKNTKNINFIGNIEAREIPNGGADVIVCDAFVGNVILKMFEGTGSMFMDVITRTLKSNPKTMIGALLIKGELKKSMKGFSTKDYGGAPLLGLKGLLVKTHGNSTSVEIKNSILQCRDYKEMNFSERLNEKLAEETEDNITKK